MISINFKHLHAKWPELSLLGSFAEQYAYPDPGSGLVKLRSFAEQVVAAIYSIHHYPKPYQANLYDLLNQHLFRDNLAKAVLDKLHFLRIQGNTAAHGGTIHTDTALTALREAYDIGCWLYLAYGSGKKEDCPPFQPPQFKQFKDSDRETKKKLKELPVPWSSTSRKPAFA